MLLKVKKNLFMGMHPFQINKIENDGSVSYSKESIISIQRGDIFLKFENKFSSTYKRNIVKILHNNQMFWAFEDYFEEV